MSRGVNKAVIVGNLGQDPDVRYATNGNAVVNLNVATNETWKNRETGEAQQRTEWHRIVFFNRLAEIAGEYLRKGSQVYVEGRLQTRKWQGQDGQDRYTTEVVASEMQMLGGRGEGGGAPSQGASSGGFRDRPQQQQSEPESAPEFQDDDIPF